MQIKDNVETQAPASDGVSEGPSEQPRFNYDLKDLQSALSQDNSNCKTDSVDDEFALVGDNTTDKFDKKAAVDVAVKSLNDYSPVGPPAPPSDDPSKDIHTMLEKIRDTDGQKGVDEFEKSVNSKLRYGLEFKVIGKDGAYRIGPSAERTKMVNSAQKHLSERQLDGPPISPDGWDNISKSLETVKKNGGQAAADEFCKQVNSKVWTGYEIQQNAKGFSVGPSKEKMDTIKQVAEIAAKEASGVKLTEEDKARMEETLVAVAMSPPEQLGYFNSVVNSLLPKGTKFEASKDMTYKATKSSGSK